MKSRLKLPIVVWGKLVFFAISLGPYRSPFRHFGQDFHFLLQNPRTPEGFQKGFRRGLWRVFEGFLKGFRPFWNPSKTLRKPFRDPFRDPFWNPSETLVGSGGSVAGNESLDTLGPKPRKSHEQRFPVPLGPSCHGCFSPEKKKGSFQQGSFSRDSRDFGDAGEFFLSRVCLSDVVRANRFARFARIGNSSDSGESAWRAIKIGVSIANDSRESRCESPVPLR